MVKMIRLFSLTDQPKDTLPSTSYARYDELTPARRSLTSMSRTSADDQPPGAFRPSHLFYNLLGRAFEHFATAAPTVLQVTSTDQGFSPVDFPAWSTREVASIAELSTAASELIASGPVLLFPPWQRRQEVRDAISRHEHELVLLDCVPSGPGSLLAAVVPASTMVSRGSNLFRRALVERWQPILVQYTRGVIDGIHHQFMIATVFLRAHVDEVPPLRMFECCATDDESTVLADLDQLLTRKGGQGQFGYVLYDVPDPGESLGFARHDPRLKAKRDALSGFGRAATIEELFDTPNPGYHLIASRELECAANAPGAVRIISGRDIKRDGTIALPDERTEWAKVPQDQQLRVGDLLIQRIAHPTDRRGLAAVEVIDADLPAAATQHVAVLRPKLFVDPPHRVLILQYLRSTLAHELLAAVDIGVHISLQALRELALPQPDEALSAALADLAKAVRSFGDWHTEAEVILLSAFPDNEDFEAARAQLVEHGRISRLRLEAASNLDNHGYIVRTRFPYPVAYRWRAVEAEASAGISRDAYDAVLQAAEVLLCYAAHLALVLARDANIEIGYSNNIRSSLARGKGLGFGDWAAILEEVRDGKAFRNIPDAHPLNDVRSMLRSPDATSARRRLNERRNDESHLRKVDPTDLPIAFDSAFADLSTLLKCADFLSDLSLIHITAVRWDSIQRQATVSYRELMGDHPVAPTRTMMYDEPSLEVDSLYLVDSQHRLHLLRPFLIGAICPTCRNWSTFHVDGFKQDVVTLKTLEHGHTMKDTFLVDPLRKMGLLSPRT